MTTYAIGDVQGCYSALRQLLDQIKFDPAADTLWFAGDLVNRGSESLQTLRFVKSLGNAAITVLGNHDLHLMALFYGLRPRGKDPTLEQVLNAPDVEALISWLQHLPLLHQDSGFIMVHAGVHPHWSLQTATHLARELETEISGLADKSDLQPLYGNSSGNWQEAEHSPHRLRFALNCFTRMRYCDLNGMPDFKSSDTPGAQPDHLTPWFKVPKRQLAEQPVIFGHWSALGLYNHHPVHGLDSGCVWGNALSAMRLSDFEVFDVSCDKS